MTAVLETNGLGKRYGRQWALRDCTLSIPEARSSGSSGRTGRARPRSASGRRVARADRGHDRRARRTSRRRPGPARDGSASSPRTPPPTPGCRWPSTSGWALGSTEPGTTSWPRRRIEQLGLDPGQRAGSLSGGQRAQLALTLAIAKRPELLLLDEPVASLDPLARREFLQDLMEVVAEHGVSVVLSSHLVADLERVCDYLVVLVASAGAAGRGGRRAAGVASPPFGTPPRPGHPPGEPGSHRGKPHRQAEHAPRAHRRADPRSGLDRQAGHAWRTSCSPT